MTDLTSKTKRPSSITLISVFGVLGGLLSFYFLISIDIQKIGIWNFIFIIFGGIIFLACGIGFWLMKKWAVYTFAVFGIIDQIVLLVLGRWTIMALLIPVIVVYVGYRNLSKMS